MVSLLAKVSVLPVIEATQGMAVEQDHVYVIPSQSYLGINAGLLQLCDPPTPLGHKTAIDFFLQSLAKDQGERAIGIVLSGTGSHGTLGIRDIKLAGGMAIAQEPLTAEFDSMPASIIRQGLADYVIPPSEIAARLAQYIRQTYHSEASPDIDGEQLDEKRYAKILEQLLKHTQCDFSSYRKNMMLRRIQRRMGLHHLDYLEQYVALLEADPQEALALYRDLLISVTAFFRDPDAFQALRGCLLPRVTSRAASPNPFRVWVPGCATGEEAYSLALLLLECFDQRPTPTHHSTEPTQLLQVFASDVDETAIAIARAGAYPSSISNDVTQNRLERFFTQVDLDHFQICKQLRELIVFSRQNLIHDAPFSKIDLISCRNLLIYLEPEMQRQVISLFHFALSDDGLLMLGPSESISYAAHLFKPISKKWRIFQKLPSNRRSRIPMPLVGAHRTHGQHAMQSRLSPLRNSHKELVEKALISIYSPASVLVNRRYEVLYVIGPVVNYLQFPAGEISHNLLSMCRPGLRTKLRFACQKTIEKEVDTKVDTQIKRGEEKIECTIDVRRMKIERQAETLLMISFFDKTKNDSHTLSGPVDSPDAKIASYADQLERELKSNSEELGGVIEELEDANEDLKTSNEEVMSMNEELQSANEELETSKEELQSLNEELSSVNSELLEKVTELDVANNDILNLLASTQIATLFLDTELLIQRFTPPTVRLLNLRSTDIGRPLSDITTRFIDDCFLSDCRCVIEEATAIQSTIEGDNSRMYLRAILPYRTHGDKILGVVITFVDLTDRLLLEKSLKQSKDHLEAILDAAADAILTVDDKGIIARLNPATESLFGYSHEQILGKSVLMFLTPGESRRPAANSTLQMFPMSECESGSCIELRARREDGTEFDAELTASRIDYSSLFIVVIRDVSQRKDLQKKILEIASDEQRRIGQELHDGTQQELTGLSLIAGTIEDFLTKKMDHTSRKHPTLTLEQADVSTLLLNVSKLVQGLSQANQHVQSLSHGIMPVQIDAEGLISALTELALETTVAEKVDCVFVHHGTFACESNTIATHLYRIAQEAINNAQRHGEAKAIRVELTAETDQVILEINDNGSGIDASLTHHSEKRNHGAGIQIMGYRARVIGGTLSIVAGHEYGTTVRCTVPI